MFVCQSKQITIQDAYLSRLRVQNTRQQHNDNDDNNEDRQFDDSKQQTTLYTRIIAAAPNEYKLSKDIR